MTVRTYCFRTLLVTSLTLIAGAGGVRGASPTSSRPSVIFDTDMGSDCDDAGALAVLRKEQVEQMCS